MILELEDHLVRCSSNYKIIVFNGHLAFTFQSESVLREGKFPTLLRASSLDQNYLHECVFERYDILELLTLQSRCHFFCRGASGLPSFSLIASHRKDNTRSNESSVELMFPSIDVSLRNQFNWSGKTRLPSKTISRCHKRAHLACL